MTKSNYQYIKNVTSEFKNQMDATYSYVESLSSIANSLKKSEFAKSIDSDYEKVESIFNSYLTINKIMNLMKTNPKAFYDASKKVSESNKSEESKESKEFDSLIIDNEGKSIEDINEIILNAFIKNQNEEIRKYTDEVYLYIDNDELSLNSKNSKFNIIFQKYLEVFEKQSNYKELLLKTSLISVSNSFESLINNFIFLIMRKDENCLKNKEISFSRIDSFESIEELKESLIEESVQDILRGNQESWLNYISDKTGKGKSFFKDQNFDEEIVEKFEEFFLARNLITHNNSTINNIYINKVKKYTKIKKDYEPGEKLVLTEEYLIDHLDLIYFIAIKTCYILGFRYGIENKDEMFEFLSKVAYSNLKERPQLSVSIYEMLLRESNTHPMIQRLLFSINYLQALKWNDENDKFDKVLAELDFSTASPIHKMCLSVLKDDFKAAVVYLKTAVEKNPDDFFDKNIAVDQRLQQLVDWPLFKKFKGCTDFKQYLESIDLDNEIIYLG